MFFLASLLSYSVIQKIIAQQKRSSSEQAYHRHHREERHGSGHDEDRRDEDVSQTFPITCFGTQLKKVIYMVSTKKTSTCKNHVDEK